MLMRFTTRSGCLWAVNVPFLSHYEALNGVDYDADLREKGFVVSDGEHPSELAGQFMAELLSKMG